MTAPNLERRPPARPWKVKRGEGACQLCPVTWDGKARPQAVTTVAGIKLCERHLINLLVVAGTVKL